MTTSSFRLHGPHQGHNAAVALAAVEAFVGGGEHRLDIDVIRAGMAGASSPGRLEIVRRSPTVLVDAAHNPAGALALRAALEDSFNFAKLVGVIAILEDKAATRMLEILEPVLNEIVVSAARRRAPSTPTAWAGLLQRSTGRTA